MAWNRLEKGKALVNRFVYEQIAFEWNLLVAVLYCGVGCGKNLEFHRKKTRKLFFFFAFTLAKYKMCPSLTNGNMVFIFIGYVNWKERKGLVVIKLWSINVKNIDHKDNFTNIDGSLSNWANCIFFFLLSIAFIAICSFFPHFTMK